ncbi:MAG: glutamine-hydrolyzing GMP synthase [Bacteroidales bacterium]
MHNKILILDFGSQYTQLIARRVRELNVYCEIHPFNKYPEIDGNVKGVILSGSPFSVHDPASPKPDLGKIRGKLPVLGICYGAQLLAQQDGGKVTPSNTREYGRAMLTVNQSGCALFKGFTAQSQVWMSHGDTITEIPSNFQITASTEEVKVGSFLLKNEQTYGIQFHPEVYHTTEGLTLLRNFTVEICGCKQDWTPASFAEETISNLKSQLANDKVVLGLSGGVDSSVAALLLHKAIGKNLTCIFVDNGLLRKDEFEQVLESYKTLGLNVIGIDAKQMFYDDLKGIVDPELKRKSIGKNFINVFEAEAKKITNVSWLAQGTIYPDVIESVSVNGPSVTIKSHHNVGGLPEKMNLNVVEPLRLLFKDEVRRVGKELGLPANILGRHPFPGPGLGIRVLGEVTQERVTLLQKADSIYVENLKKYDLYDKIWQAGAILLPVQTVGVMGDERTYEYVVALRAVTSTDGMTADWYPLPYEFMSKLSNEIINKVKGINRVVYDISSKPPATIEWE